ncbi:MULTISPECIES: DUF1206 domain-containing protein [unclassified Peribacillus]|uniref:DUF1206 domain-containing protein n=1 Tax=Peribacillus TaxID=2675229 RepID=UPI0036DCF9E9
MSVSLTKEQAKQKVSKANHELKPWIRRFGRFGYMAKGTVYVLLGLLAAMAAFGIGGKVTGTNGVLQSIAAVPFGEVLLWLIGIGLLGYIIWQIIKAIKDPENKGHDAKGIITRAAYLVSAIIYGSLAFSAFKLALHAGHAGGGSEQTISANLLSKPFGQWIVGLVGAIIIGYGVHEILSGVKEKFMKKFKVSEMNEHETKIARNSGKIGLLSRGIVLGMIGVFFIKTAVTADPNQTKGLGGALSELAKQPYGLWLLGIVGLGLMLYGVYGIIRGRYEHFNFGR